MTGYFKFFPASGKKAMSSVSTETGNDPSERERESLFVYELNTIIRLSHLACGNMLRVNFETHYSFSHL